MNRNRRDPHAYAEALKAAEDADERRVVDELNAAVQRIVENAPDGACNWVAIATGDERGFPTHVSVPFTCLSSVRFQVPTSAEDRADDSFATRTMEDADHRRAMRDRLIAAAIATHERIAGHIDRLRRDPRNASAVGVAVDYESAIMDGDERDRMIDAADDLADIVKDIHRIEGLMQERGDDAITRPIRPRPVPDPPKSWNQSTMFGGGSRI